jgi:carbamoyl-phosphate synthase large subunit
MRKGNKLYLTEINPRFGGGYPLSYYAGANFIEHIKKRINKEKVLPIKNYNRTVINTVMSRYDNAFYWIEDNHDKSYRS